MRLPVPRDISLANKCLLLFGGAIVLIVVAALVGPFMRMSALVEERQLELARRSMDVWQRLDAQYRELGIPIQMTDDGLVDHAGIRVRWTPLIDGSAIDDQGEQATPNDEFAGRALVLFEGSPERTDSIRSSWKGAARMYRYARPVWDTTERPPVLVGVLTLERQSDDTAVLHIVNAVYLLSAGLVVLALALVVFYLITHRIILSPVRSLRGTAEAVRHGDLSSRSVIKTGDEFEELAEAFNAMLSELYAAQERQRSVNRALDMKLSELAEANSSLYQANRLKGEFLASVSHELRTPLNSIIGFAELLLEIAESDRNEQASPALTKRIRYLENIVRASRSLLELIEQLLEMARIEAGKVELRIEPMSVRDACETLGALIEPLAARKRIDVNIEVPDGLPTVQTDHKRLQQILFNLLANAVKFIQPPDRTGVAGAITIRAERLLARGEHEPDSMRLSVIDTGPGIPQEQQDKIFDKFHQVEAGHTRGSSGTGLGLAICAELATLLQGEIQVVSEVGRGSMFSLIIPVDFDHDRARETSLEQSFRGSLTSGVALDGG